MDYEQQKFPDLWYIACALHCRTDFAIVVTLTTYINVHMYQQQLHCTCVNVSVHVCVRVHVHVHEPILPGNSCA